MRVATGKSALIGLIGDGLVLRNNRHLPRAARARTHVRRDSILAPDVIPHYFVVRWDDLQILSAIDEHEGSVGPVTDGLRLMDQCRAGKQPDYQKDPPSFAHELQIARSVGLIEFEVVAFAPADPRTDAYQWLQQLRDIRLTIAGRDRARGRIVVAPLPDPESDDGRMITGYTLEQIARAIAETYTTRQLPRFLRDAGIPSEFAREPENENKWEYVTRILEELLVGGSASRRVLRTFIGAWLTGQLHAPPSQQDCVQITALLAQQGWHVRDRVLVIGERATGAVPMAPAGSRRARIAGLHPVVREAAERYIEDHLEVAIFESFKAVNKRVKDSTGLAEDGSPLMAKAFGEDKDSDPPIRLADVSNETGRNVQSGFKLIFMGAVRGIRNPDAHELFRPVDEQQGLESLALASMLMRRLDSATIKRREAGA